MEKFNLPIGTLLFSSNLDPNENNTPGLFNHVAIILDSEQNIIEAQAGRGVIITSWDEYSKRAYNWNNFGVLYPRSKEIGIKAAEAGRKYIGYGYAPLASIRNLRRKFSCVSLANRMFSEATNLDVKSVIPDDFIKYINIFTDKFEEVN